MGKTKGKAPVKAVPPMVVSTPVVSGAGTSTSSSASANSYQNLIRSLFSIPEGPSEERTEILKKLAAEYKFLASSNKLNVMKDRYLTEEVQEIQLKYNSASADYNKAKEEHDAQNSKYIKLKQLSQQLSDRTKQLDAKAAAALYEEQQKRVKLTESFSGSIASISSKLDSLTTRRELVVTENIRLKAVLKSYLEEFDADQKAQEVQAGDSTTPPVQGAADESPPALDPPISTETQETTSPTEEGDVSVAASSLVAAEDSASKTKADSVEDVVETPAGKTDFFYRPQVINDPQHYLYFQPSRVLGPISISRPRGGGRPGGRSPGRASRRGSQPGADGPGRGRHSPGPAACHRAGPACQDRQVLCAVRLLPEQAGGLQHRLSEQAGVHRGAQQGDGGSREGEQRRGQARVGLHHVHQGMHHLFVVLLCFSLYFREAGAIRVVGRHL